MASALATRTRPRPPVQFKRDEDVPSVCVSRVKKDVADIARDPPPGIYVAPNENDVTRIDALVVGPSGTPYEGGFLWFHRSVPARVPNAAAQGHFDDDGRRPGTAASEHLLQRTRDPQHSWHSRRTPMELGSVVV
ncbi:hypothetical protein MRX96_004916 [Rhipicephalus microplus]